jgi:hypothetical protein
VALQNRVTPRGDLIAAPERGLVYGNRGCLHDGSGRVRRHHDGRRWIACRLSFKDWKRSPLMQPGHFTELFFLDDATALAAGHRPCALCRREDYRRFTGLWRGLHPTQRGADAIDSQLHGERMSPHREAVAGLPDGAFLADGDAALLVLGDELLDWAPGGYGSRRPRPRGGSASVLTPASLVELLRAGWLPTAVPLLHPSAG